MEIDGLQICLVPLTGNIRVELDCIVVSDGKKGNGSGEGEVTISQDWKMSINTGVINRIKNFISAFFCQNEKLFQACIGKIYTNS